MPILILGILSRWLKGIATGKSAPGLAPRLLGPKLTPVRPGSLCSGFSLVEVVIAIGIVAFAFVGMLGLIPIGMTTFNQAMDISVSSQIVDQVINEAKQTDFDTLIDGAQANRTFDRDGDETLDPKFTIYDVRVSVNKSTALPNTSTPDSVNLATLVIQIAQNPGRKADPFDPQQKIPVSTSAALIARNQTKTP